MVRIRVMTAEDYDGVYALWSHTPGLRLNPVDDSPRGIQAYLARNPSTSFVAEAQGRIVGALLAGHDGRRGFLYHAAVHPQFRRRGIGARLAEHAVTALEREGIQKAALVAFAQNEAGNRFWDRMGFSRRTDLVYRNRATHPADSPSP